ncbi:hypothetical protein [Streptomyces caatingaensis]|nr:hypothetical protein [Streptomyces caatingaensis]
MSFLRRAMVVSLTAIALAAGGGSAAAAPQAPSAAAFHDDDGFEGHPGFHHRARPIHFGPFEIPHSGGFSGGFQWGTSGGGFGM